MRLSITTRNVLVVVMSVLLLGGMISFISIKILSDSLETKITDQLSLDALHRMNKLDRFLFERLGDFTLLSKDEFSFLSGNGTSVEQKMAYLATIEREKPFYHSFSLYDVNGTKIASTNGTRFEETIADAEFYRYAMAGYIYVDSKPTYSEELGAEIIHFAAPILTENESTAYVVSAVFLVDTLNDIVSDIDDETTAIDLTDRDGNIIYSNAPEDPAMRKITDLGSFARVRWTDDTIIATRAEFRGEERVIVVAEQQGFEDYVGEGWVLITSVPADMAFAPVRELKVKLLLLTALVLMVIMAISVLFTRLTTLPIILLEQSAKRISKGDFDARVDIRTGDELEELGEIFNKSVEQLKANDEDRKHLEKLKGQFMSMTTHELRSPMASIIMMLGQLADGTLGEMSAEQKEYMLMILGSAKRLNSLLDDFMTLTKLEQARLQFAFKHMSLNDPIKGVLEEMKHFMPEKHIAFTADVDPLPEFDVDPDRTMQVLRNIMNNAVKFSPVDGRIIVTVKKREKDVLFSVQDFGRGIAKADQAKLFEPFNQGSSSTYENYGGTGLGITICKGIIECQDGKLWFESEPGKGTTFFFTVPYEPVREMRPMKYLFFGKDSVKE
jgi:signal transduction histidine kinase